MNLFSVIPTERMRRANLFFGGEETRSFASLGALDSAIVTILLLLLATILAFAFATRREILARLELSGHHHRQP